MFKKRWSDGLQDDFDHLNEFEFKLGCFGGDGGSSGGGGSTNDGDGGGYGSAGSGSGGYGDGDSDTGGMGSGDSDTGGGGGGGGNDAVSDFQNQVASGMFSGPPSAPASYGTPASYGPNAGVPAGYSTGVPSMGLGIGVNAPVSDIISGYTSTGTPTSTADVMAAALGINNNIAGFDVVPGMVGNAPGLIGTIDFREGGAVGYPGYGQGMSGGGGIMSVLEPFGNYLTEQIDTQRVDPFLETVSNAAYQEFGIKPSQGGGGGGFFSGDFYKTNLGGDFSGMPPPLPAVQQPVMNMNTELPGPVANLSNFGPDVGNGGLFGGGLASTVAPSPDGLNPSIPSSVSSTPVPQDVRSAYEAEVKSAQEQRKNGFMGRVVLPGEMGFDRFAEGYNYRLNNPNLQPLTSVGNDGFGSFTQGPLDFLDGSNIAQPIGLPQIDQGFYDSQEYNAFNSGPKMGTSDIAFSRYFGQQGSGSISGQQDAAYEDYLRRTGQANKIITTNPYSNLLGVLPGGGMFEGQPLTPASGAGNLVDAYGNPASFSPAELEAMLAATPISSFQQGPNLSRPAPVPMGVLPGGGLITGQPGPGFGLPSGNGPGGVTLRPTPGAMPVEAFMGGSSTFDESAPYPISMQVARSQFG